MPAPVTGSLQIGFRLDYLTEGVFPVWARTNFLGANAPRHGAFSIKRVLYAYEGKKPAPPA